MSDNTIDPLMRNAMILGFTALGVALLSVALKRYGIEQGVTLGLGLLLIAFVYARVTG